MKKKSNWTPKSQSGAKEGLEKKMKYWEEKDFQMEFSIAVGQAFNLAYQKGMGVVNGENEDIREEVYHIFRNMLTAKLEDRFLESFAEYYERKKNKDDIKTEAKQPTLEDPNIETINLDDE